MKSLFIFPDSSLVAATVYTDSAYQPASVYFFTQTPASTDDDMRAARLTKCYQLKLIGGYGLRMEYAFFNSLSDFSGQRWGNRITYLFGDSLALKSEVHREPL